MSTRLWRWGGRLGVAIALLSLTACAGTSWGDRVQTSLEQDPQLQADNAATPTVNLPDEIPVYANATPQPVPIDLVLPNEPFGELTYWGTNDDLAEVTAFYQAAFQTDGWALASNEAGEDNASENNANNNDALQTLAAQREDLEVIVTLLPGRSEGDLAGHFAIQYRTAMTADGADADPATEPASESGDAAVDSTETDASAEATENQTTDTTTAAPDAQEPGFSLPTTGDRPAPGSQSTAQSGVNAAPAELRPYINDVLALNVLQFTTGNATGAIAPNQPVTRRQFARWLVAVNNLYYADQPGEQIRLAVPAAEPVFTDLPTSDPDFGAIQGLAEAGVIPSSLTGNTTTVTFRPDAPLTRADLLVWKVPLDLRQALPNVTVDAVRQAWGFQDAAALDARVLGAVMGDRQTGDLANIKRSFGYTTLLQPEKPVTQAEAVAALWRIGTPSAGFSAADVLARQDAG